MTGSLPLVSVICLCYNHERFVREAVESVIHQTYPNIQIIVADDASTDASADVIRQLKMDYPQIELLLFEQNLGNCKAFNKALALVKGDFVIDFATDDVLLPNRVEQGVFQLQKQDESYGVHFCDAEYINETGEHLYNHSDRFPHESIPQGNVYKELIARYFICPTSLMFRRSIIDNLNGYDESLHYEDFDFLIRSSRITSYCYAPEIFVKRRLTQQALSKRQFTFRSKASASTYKVCEKILYLNRNKEEQQALGKRLMYESLLNFRLFNFTTAFRFLRLAVRNRKMKYAE